MQSIKKSNQKSIKNQNIISQLQKIVRITKFIEDSQYKQLTISQQWIVV